MQSRDFHSHRFTLTEVADQVGVHVKTVQRWAMCGVRGKQLRSILIGGRRYVLPRDLAEFLDDSTARSSRDSDLRNSSTDIDDDKTRRKRRGGR
jgi:hypothetical protein